jgi:hypothetical protein
MPFTAHQAANTPHHKMAGANPQHDRNRLRPPRAEVACDRTQSFDGHESNRGGRLFCRFRRWLTAQRFFWCVGAGVPLTSREASDSESLAPGRIIPVRRQVLHGTGRFRESFCSIILA